MKKFFQNYSLSIVLAVLFFASWGGHFVFQAIESGETAKEHGQSFSWDNFWPEFGASTLENWQSEFLQLLSMVVLTSFLVHKGSAESKDGNDKMQAALARIDSRLDKLEKAKR
jgi:hypothetical protein